jgi:alkanesulfonate monooxygenase SsuD/methylene tetrahydromethanopterin reductase-like flavin-dependent oxidoreductase (luciferase family)
LAWPSWRRSPECLGEIEEAEALGYQTVWLSQHHLTWDGFVSSPEAHDRS